MTGAAMSIALLLFHLLSDAAAEAAAALPGCRPSCGKVDIPYPYGIGRNCSIDETFVINCDKSRNGVEKPFHSDLELVNIMLPLGRSRYLNHISSQCYDIMDKSIKDNNSFLSMDGGFRFSDEHNKFTVIGCQTLAYIKSQSAVGRYQIGCVSACQDEESLRNNSCVGTGCCQMSIPKDLQYYEVQFDKDYNTSSIYNLSRCSFAVLMEVASFHFQASYITTNDFIDENQGKAPVLVDWAIGNTTCEVAKHNNTSYACISEHSECLNSVNAPGYLCVTPKFVRPGLEGSRSGRGPNPRCRRKGRARNRSKKQIGSTPASHPPSDFDSEASVASLSLATAADADASCSTEAHEQREDEGNVGKSVTGAREVLGAVGVVASCAMVRCGASSTLPCSSPL